MVMTCLQAKVQGQQLVVSEDRVKTNGRTDGRTVAIALPVASISVLICFKSTDNFGLFKVGTNRVTG